MANANAPYGLRPVRHSTGGCIRTNEYTIAASYSTVIYTGDVVEQVTGGGIEQAAAASANVIGVFWGCSFVDGSGNQVFSKHWTGDAAATEIKAFVYDDPDIIFQVQGNAIGHAAADVFGQADIVVTAGTTAVGRSKSVLSDTVGTTGNFRILRLVNDPDNAWGAYNDVEVVAAEHIFNTTGAGLA